MDIIQNKMEMETEYLTIMEIKHLNLYMEIVKFMHIGQHINLL